MHSEHDWGRSRERSTSRHPEERGESAPRASEPRDMERRAKIEAERAQLMEKYPDITQEMIEVGFS